MAKIRRKEAWRWGSRSRRIGIFAVSPLLCVLSVSLYSLFLYSPLCNLSVCSVLRNEEFIEMIDSFLKWWRMGLLIKNGSGGMGSARQYGGKDAGAVAEPAGSRRPCVLFYSFQFQRLCFFFLFCPFIFFNLLKRSPVLLYLSD